MTNIIKNPPFDSEKERFKKNLLSLSVNQVKQRLGLQYFNWILTADNDLSKENIESILMPLNMPEYNLSKEEQMSIDNYTYAQKIAKNILTSQAYLDAYEFYEKLDEKMTHWKIKYRLIHCLTRLKEYKKALQDINILIEQIEEEKKLIDNQFNQIDFSLEKQDKNRIEPPRNMNRKKVLGDCWSQKASIAHFLKYDVKKIIEYYEKAYSYNPTDPVININLLKFNATEEYYEKATNIFNANKKNNTFLNLCKQTSKTDNDLMWLIINKPEFQILN